MFIGSTMKLNTLRESGLGLWRFMIQGFIKFTTLRLGMRDFGFRRFSFRVQRRNGKRHRAVARETVNKQETYTSNPFTTKPLRALQGLRV